MQGVAYRGLGKVKASLPTFDAAAVIRGPELDKLLLLEAARHGHELTAEEERAAIDRHVSINVVGGPLLNLLEMSGITVRNLEDAFDIRGFSGLGARIAEGDRTAVDDLEKRAPYVPKRTLSDLRTLPYLLSPEGRESLEEFAKLFLEMRVKYKVTASTVYSEIVRLLGQEEADRLSANLPQHDSTVFLAYLGSYVKDWIVDVVGDTLSKIFLEYINTAGRLRCYRAVRFATMERRDEYVAKVKESGIEGHPKSKWNIGGSIPVTIFKSFAEDFAQWSDLQRYGAVMSIDFSRVDAYPIRYNGIGSTAGVDLESLWGRSAGEFRIRGSVPPEAIIGIELVDPTLYRRSGLPTLF